MRDIPKINYNTSVKNKTIVNENESSGVLTKCTFKSYKDFLENYENKNTKDDQESISSTDSGISETKSCSNSTSSLNSENGSVSKMSQKINGSNNERTGSFRKYLENYSNKKFSSVKPVVNKQNVIKSEIVIQVNAPEMYVPTRDEPDTPDFPPPPSPFQLSPISQGLPSSPVLLSPPLSIPSPPPLIPSPPPIMQSPDVSIPPPPPLFENINQCTPKKWAMVETENHPVKEKQVSPNVAATNLAAILTQNALFKRKANESENVIECNKPVEKPLTPQIAVNRNNTLPRTKAPEFINHRTITIEVPLNSSPKVLNDVEYNTTTVVPIADKSSAVKTSDPNVKKMVYNTYRGLLGAYNNKANDMVATLPRTMVREDRGISRQLESIALRGGLEKINGRTNPKVEME